MSPTCTRIEGQRLSGLPGVELENAGTIFIPATLKCYVHQKGVVLSVQKKSISAHVN
jgi:hypothetical protein